LRRLAALLAIAGLTLLVLVAVIGGPAARATFPDRNGLIAFSGDKGSGAEIYTIKPDGTGLRRLTNIMNGDAGSPNWSRDGTRIAFGVEDKAVYVMNADGSDQTALTDNGAISSFPAWSPDGTKIAFSVYRRSGELDIYVMNADGSNQTNLTPDSDAYDSDPEWSPDGTKLTFVSSRDGDAEIYVMNADGSNQTNLTTNGAEEYDHAWSPDGNEIVFTSTRSGYARIYVMNADGTKQKQLKTGKLVGGYVDHPDWQPLVQATAVTTQRNGDQGDHAAPKGHGKRHGSHDKGKKDQSHGHKSHGKGGKQR
jgi:Tol biopolymer transport system component